MKEIICLVIGHQRKEVDREVVEENEKEKKIHYRDFCTRCWRESDGGFIIVTKGQCKK